MKLSIPQLSRYSRHLSIPGFCENAQLKLATSKVLVIGAGGLGSPCITYLAAAGVGEITVVDDDNVELSNLQRQVIHKESWIGKSKAQSAGKFISDLNSDVDVNIFNARLDVSNVLSFMQDKDVVIDCSDNFKTRYLISDACALLGVPCVWGSVLQLQGQISVFFPPASPCYRCLYPTPPPPELAPSCANGGVLGALCGIIGASQAAEAIKVVTGIQHPLYGRLWMIDIGDFQSRVLSFSKKEECVLCGPNATISRVTPIVETSCEFNQLKEIDAHAFEKIRKGVGDFEDFIIIDVREPHEWEISSIPETRLVSLGDLVPYLQSDTKRNLVFVCKTGVRARQAAAIAKEYKYNAYILKGGIVEWERVVNGKFLDC